MWIVVNLSNRDAIFFTHFRLVSYQVHTSFAKMWTCSITCCSIFLFSLFSFGVGYTLLLCHCCQSHRSALFENTQWDHFRQKHHCNHLKWVSACQSPEQLGKEDTSGKNKMYDAAEIGVVF